MSLTFAELVADQFKYGGTKYANTNEKEVTDQLTEDYGFNGLLWSINKYVYRYKNLGREKDLLKIACYMFIIWLKFGSHRVGILSKIYRFLGLWVNTTVDVKTKFFPEFMERLKNFAFVCPVCTDKTTAAFLLTFLLRQLRNPCNRTEANLFAIYRLVERLWKTDGHDQVVEHDTDTGKSKESK